MAQASDPLRSLPPPAEGSAFGSPPPSPSNSSDGGDDRNAARVAAEVMAMDPFALLRENGVDEPPSPQNGVLQTVLEIADADSARELPVAFNMTQATNRQRIDARNSLCFRIATGAFLALSAVALGFGYGQDSSGLQEIGWYLMACSGISDCARRFS